MRAALYAHVSTSDRDQNPEAQLLPLREFVMAQGWHTFQEYTDLAPATGLAHRTAWRKLLDDATTLERLRAWGVGLRSYADPWLDTTSPFSEALYYITVAYAQLERGILRERVKAGMERARKQGHRIGRPRVTDRRGFSKRCGAILERLSAGEISRWQAAQGLGIGYVPP